MLHKTFTKLIAAAATAVVMAAPVVAADYPSKPIELTVPFAAGGGTDLVARAFADAMKPYLPQSIGVVNKTGGGGAVGLSEISAARPDGYKIGLGTAELVMLPNLGIVRFKPTDFTPIARLNADPAAITVNAESPFKTFKDFLDYAEANPGKVRIGNSGTGAIWHLAAEALGQKVGAKFTNIPYEGANPAVTALLGNHIEAVSVSPAEVSAHVAAGTLRILAVMSDERLAAFPDVPTLKEQGVDLSVATWRGIFVPAKTPQAVVDTLREASAKAAQEQSFKDALAKLNLNYAYLPGPEFQTQIDKDTVFFKDLMTSLGMAR